jgi:hypothetical protein
MKPHVSAAFLPLFALLVACAPSPSTTDLPSVSNATVAPSEIVVDSATPEPTETATVEPANLVIGPETLGQIRLMWSAPFAGDDSDLGCRSLIETCQMGTRIGAYAFSPDSNLLAVGICLGERTVDDTLFSIPRWGCTAESIIVLYDPVTGEERARFKPASLPISLTFHPDGNLLAAGLVNSDIELWDTATAELTATLPRPNFIWFGVRSVAFTPDGNLLITSAGQTQMQIWDWRTPRVEARIEQVFSVGGVSPDGSKLLALHFSQQVADAIRVHDLSDPDNFSEIPLAGHSQPTLFYFDPVTGLLAITGATRAYLVNFWDLSSETMVGSLSSDRDFTETGVSYGVDNGGFTPDGYFLITRKGYLVAPETQPETPLSQLPQACGFALFDVEANQIFHAPDLGTYEIEIEGQVFPITLCANPDYMYSMGLINEVARILSPDSRFIAGEDVDGTFYVWGVDPSQPYIAPECFGDC